MHVIHGRSVRILASLALLGLMGCGADGEPVQPTMNATVAVTSNGVYPAVGVGLHQGPVSVFFGF